jgi:hypothetical protein
MSIVRKVLHHCRAYQHCEICPHGTDFPDFDAFDTQTISVSAQHISAVNECRITAHNRKRFQSSRSYVCIDPRNQREKSLTGISPEQSDDQGKHASLSHLNAELGIGPGIVELGSVVASFLDIDLILRVEHRALILIDIQHPKNLNNGPAAGPDAAWYQISVSQ